MKNILPTCLFCLFLVFICTSRGEDKLVVHEWGTFTSLQDEEGRAIGGINTDDEPLPNFVHRLAYYLLLPADRNDPASGAAIAGFSVASKGITPKCHPDVTMRLETPVLYFYPPAGWKSRPVDVHVGFPGGWLSEYYPDAIFKAPGFDRGHPDRAYSNEPGSQQFEGFGHIKKDAIGEMSWKGLTIGAEGAGPETTEKVWLAPRDVKAATVKTSGGETEKFLFYRGVGNVDASLKIVRNEATKTFEIHRKEIPEAMVMGNPEGLLGIHAAWLVQVLGDGSCAFRSQDELKWNERTATSTVIPCAFEPQAFSSENMLRLKKEMRDTLIAKGLFADEADALLKTWEISYFKTPGLRFFYICPRYDVDKILPLQIPDAGTVKRVMIGRIEIVTPEQRALLGKIAADAQYSDYVKLGRFRNALILDEQKRRPTAALGDFIQKNQLEAYKIE